MLLAVDIGNTTVALAFMEEQIVRHSFHLMTASPRTADEFSVFLTSFIATAGLHPRDLNQAVISSVVPALTQRVAEAIAEVTGATSHLVDPRYAGAYGVTLDVSEPLSLGADILADCVGVQALPTEGRDAGTLVVDCGTATKYIYLPDDHTFKTLAIGLGIETGTRALTDTTALLPQVILSDPGTVMGNTTETAMQAGLYYGFLGSIDYTLRRFIDELGQRPRIVTTGGLGGLFTPALDLVDSYEPDLLFRGLALIGERIRALD